MTGRFLLLTEALESEKKKKPSAKWLANKVLKKKQKSEIEKAKESYKYKKTK